MEVIVHDRLRPLADDIGGYGLRQSEQDQRLIDEMRAKIVQQSGALQTLLPPALLDRRPEPIEMGFVMSDRTEPALVEAMAHGAETIIPAAVLEDAEQTS